MEHPDLEVVETLIVVQETPGDTPRASPTGEQPLAGSPC